jgi:hypothetical protein
VALSDLAQDIPEESGKKQSDLASGSFVNLA